MLESALASVNDPAPIEHSLGLLLVRRQQMDQALDHLRRAAESPTAPARYVYVYGVALDSQGRTDDAIVELKSAAQRYPGNQEILSALVSFLRKQGQAEQAAR